MDALEAAHNGDLAAVRAALDAGSDAAAVDEQGWSLLHRAAMGAEADPVRAAAVLAALLDAGAPVEHPGGDGRTALYLAAEFSQSPEAVELLIARGAEPDITDGHGNHITVNAWVPEVAALLAAAAGIEPPAPDEEAPTPERRLSRAQWSEARKRIGKVLDGLDAAGFVALADAGTTQSDGFDDCSEAAEGRDCGPDGLVGFCYYTGQDAEHARATGRLFLAFWGAPDGSTRKMKRAGELVVAAFCEAGFRVDWDGAGDSRPSVRLAG
ncbi:ankyrin repeat domain-containing protein [Streptomyces sp. NBC_00825]|uniref:ankyrin repeat domain-containing protein n=1 Tax=unclassified Streptomyces TaxID=2593676 RepID=UPI002ECFE4A3|nr:ankyrin repeat domain-containing protein [Streptomyces sp. NBC_00826]WTH91917.1 ankyrin repeat domain-containing protein [Streptomyces sp. NBC_00825]WTI00645.1 ankyrin repeat domain-containing protein [Streptomyces sp. NBC_00822]